MSAFSYTAPIISPREERAERDALTEEEKQKIHNDIYGGGSSIQHRIKETPEMIQNSQALLREAMNGIPDRDKVDYLEAVERVPELVDGESPSIAFLRCQHYDPWSAADRLVAYWKMRKLIFGADRAFLPMTLDGSMASEVQYLEKGIVLLLPDDKHGRPVVFWNRTGSTAAVAPRDSVARCWWYAMQQILNAASTTGYVIIVGAVGYDIYRHFDRILSKRMVSISQCMPMSVRAIHTCYGSGRTVLEIVLPVIKHILGKENRLRFLAHRASSNTELLSQFQSFGLSEAHVDVIHRGLLHRMELA